MSKLISIAATLVMEFEGFHRKRRDGRADAYPDPLHGWNVATIGYGTTRYPDGRRVQRGDVITQWHAIAYMNHELQEIEKYLKAHMPTWKRMNLNQQAALLSFGFNLGKAFYRGRNRQSITRLCDTPSLWTNRDEVTRIFTLYCNPNDPSVTEGLKRRRLAEAKLFLTPV